MNNFGTENTRQSHNRSGGVHSYPLLILLVLCLLLLAAPAWAADVVGVIVPNGTTATNPAGTTVSATLNNTTGISSTVTGIQLGTNVSSGTSAMNAGAINVVHTSTYSSDWVYGIDDKTQFGVATSSGSISISSQKLRKQLYCQCSWSSHRHKYN